MKRCKILAILLAVLCLAGCGKVGRHQVAPAQLGRQEQTFLNALADNALVFNLGAGEYEAALHCYAEGEWFDAGAMGLINGGGTLLFATQRYPAKDRLLPDAWVCSADGATMTGYMQWDEDADAMASVFGIIAGNHRLEQGQEYVLSVGAFADGSAIYSLDQVLGVAFDKEALDFTQYTHAWVFTIKAL